MRERVKLLAANGTDTQTEITFQGNTTYQHLLQPLHITDTVTTMRLAPFPHHLVLDGLHQDIPAVEMYERLLLSTHCSPMMNHAIEFCRASLVGPLRISDKKGCVSSSTWSSMPPFKAKQWRKKSVKPSFLLHFQPTQLLFLQQQQLQHHQLSQHLLPSNG